jgi:outer membrane protein TolC
LKATQATVLTALAQRKVLNKEYAPVIHFLGGVQNRGSGLNTTGREQTAEIDGLLPGIPNYQAAMIVNWNFLDWFRLRAEKRVQDQRVIAQREEYNLVLQNLKSEDERSRAQVETAIEIAHNMPLQVMAAQLAAQQAQSRYQVGLSSVAQVAEANQILAQSRMQEAVAKVAIWRAMLERASVHGDLGPLLAEANHVQRGL